MVRWKAVPDLISVLGAVVLFGAWVFQQTLLNEANGTLQSIRAAETAFETYQSNNALFNAIVSGSAAGNGLEIRRFQVINYEYGLRHLEDVLDPAQRSRIPAPLSPLDGDWTPEKGMQRINERIGAVQGAVREKKDEIAARSARVNAIFLAAYAVGSLLILAAN